MLSQRQRPLSSTLLPVLILAPRPIYPPVPLYLLRSHATARSRFHTFGTLAKGTVRTRDCVPWSTDPLPMIVPLLIVPHLYIAFADFWGHVSPATPDPFPLAGIQ